jgi:hypothetical protein
MKALVPSLVIAVWLSVSAQAGMIVKLSEKSGGGIRATYSGTLNLEALTLLVGTGNVDIYMAQTSGAAWEGLGAEALSGYQTVSGDLFSIFEVFGAKLVALSSGNVSSNALLRMGQASLGTERSISGMAVKNTGTFASLGLKQGSYTTSFSRTGADGSVASDSVTVSIVVPEPGSLSLWGLGLAGIACVGRRCRR